MQNHEISAYKNALAEKKFIPDMSNIDRIFPNDNFSPDYDVDHYEEVIDPYLIDQNKIIRSKAYRREALKTQVVYLPENPHIRTRLSHTSEVDANALIISEFLGLNTNLCRAIAMGHDIGHGPVGHLFEKVASENGVNFKHDVFSAIISVFIERNGGGLNLTRQTIEGQLSHSQNSNNNFSFKNNNQENKVVMYSDKIAYTFSDINDLDRINVFSKKDMYTINSYFPGNQRSRVGDCIHALVKESAQKGFISFEESETAQKFKEIKSLMFNTYYEKFDHSVLKESVKTVLDCVSSIKGLGNYDPIIIVALMTDKELDTITNRVRHSVVNQVTLSDIKDFGVNEIIKKGFLSGKTYRQLENDLQIRLSR
jgi:dGTP triphosphohydrolase